MAKINLLPHDIKVEQTVDISGKVIKLGLLTLTVLIAYFYGYFLTNYYSQKSQIDSLDRKLQVYSPALANLNTLKETKKELADMDAFLRDQEVNRTEWSKFLSELKGNTPEGVSIGQITAGKDGSLTIYGHSQGFANVGINYLNLKDSSYLDKININVVEEKRLDNGDPINIYTLNGHLRKGGAK